MIKTLPKLFELLEENQKKVFFDHYTKSSSLFNWPEPPREIPREIPTEICCETCAGSGKLITFGDSKDCNYCSGKGIPPIPMTEFLDPKRPSKVKNDITQNDT